MDELKCSANRMNSEQEDRMKDEHTQTDGHSQRWSSCFDYLDDVNWLKLNGILMGMLAEAEREDTNIHL